MYLNVQYSCGILDSLALQQLLDDPHKPRLDGEVHGGVGQAHLHREQLRGTDQPHTL